MDQYLAMLWVTVNCLTESECLRVMNDPAVGCTARQTTVVIRWLGFCDRN